MKTSYILEHHNFVKHQIFRNIDSSLQKVEINDLFSENRKKKTNKII